MICDACGADNQGGTPACGACGASLREPPPNGGLRPDDGSEERPPGLRHPGLICLALGVASLGVFAAAILVSISWPSLLTFLALPIMLITMVLTLTFGQDALQNRRDREGTDPELSMAKAGVALGCAIPILTVAVGLAWLIWASHATR